MRLFYAQNQMVVSQEVKVSILASPTFASSQNPTVTLYVSVDNSAVEPDLKCEEKFVLYSPYNTTIIANSYKYEYRNVSIDPPRTLPNGMMTMGGNNFTVKVEDKSAKLYVGWEPDM